LPYNREQAVQYAALWWSGNHPAFRRMPDNCTNFISQCLFAGGLPMEHTGRRDRGWWYAGPNEQWSFSWAVSNSFRWYLEKSGRAEQRPSATDLELGDLILYDWDSDGVWTHSTIVVGYDAAREPLVAAHTVPSWGRAWRYTDSPAYTRNTKYLFLHIRSA
jgi:cell wall-associated NlpC family hydrolase